MKNMRKFRLKIIKLNEEISFFNDENRSISDYIYRLYLNGLSIQI